MALTSSEEGAYIRLLAYAWLNDDCGLPDDDQQLAALSRLGRAWKSSAVSLRKQFIARNGRLYNKKLLEVRATADTWHEKQRDSGKRGAQKRWGGDADPMASPSLENGEPIATLSEIDGKPIARARASSSSSSYTSTSSIENQRSSGGGGVTPPPPLTTLPAWQRDDSYAPLIIAWGAAKPEAIDEDFARNHKYWVKFDDEQRQKAIANLCERLRLGLKTSTTLGFWLREDYKRKVIREATLPNDKNQRRRHNVNQGSKILREQLRKKP